MIKRKLKSLVNSKEIEDRFYKNLKFGTGWLRGLIGLLLIVSKATQGYAESLKKHFENASIAIAYDSRNMSKEFAKATALTMKQLRKL